MERIWKNRIIAGTRTFRGCPDQYKDGVELLLREDVEKGILSVDRFEELTGIEFQKSA